MNDRLKQFIDYLGFSVRQFEQKISASDGQIAKMLRQKTSIQTDTLAKIKENFPQLSLDWLIAGEGQMLLNSPKISAFDAILLEKYEKKVEENALIKAELAATKEAAATEAAKAGGHLSTGSLETVHI